MGNCVACHPAPNFTDFGVHNTGVTQEEYDAIHGDEAFAVLDVPSLMERDADPSAFLPTTPGLPDAQGPFRRLPSERNPNFTDLGVWNIFANEAFPAPQQRLTNLLCDIDPGDRGICTEAELLDRSIATFKTPGLRDLSHSQPFMHNGQFDTLGEVLRFYQRAAEQARAGELRNADPRVANIALSEQDIQAITLFLRSLNEDYD